MGSGFDGGGEGGVGLLCGSGASGREEEDVIALWADTEGLWADSEGLWAAQNGPTATRKDAVRQAVR
jgi:hypothetical protein